MKIAIQPSQLLINLPYMVKDSGSNSDTQSPICFNATHLIWAHVAQFDLLGVANIRVGCPVEPGMLICFKSKVPIEKIEK